MPVAGLDHVNIRTSKVNETLGFFRDILGMEVRALPGRADLAHGGWVYDGQGAAVLHIGDFMIDYPAEKEGGGQAVSGPGPVHHIAFNCQAYSQMRAGLTGRGIDYEVNDLPQMALRQLFVRDPNGVLVELNFRGE